MRDIRDIDYSDHNAPPVYAFPVNSAIVTPTEGESVTPAADGKIAVEGYAVSGAGQRVVSVRISTDGGDRWSDAELIPDAGTPPADPDSASHQPSLEGQLSRNWSWVLWRARVPVPPGTERLQLCCRATDTAYNTQPERTDYNLRGYLSNAWSKVSLLVAPLVDAPPANAKTGRFEP